MTADATPDIMKWDIGGGTPASAAIVQVMDADGKYPSEKQPMTITTTTNAVPLNEKAVGRMPSQNPLMRAHVGLPPLSAPAAPAGLSEERIREIPNPTDDDLADPLFEAIWQVTKTWDVNAPQYYSGYCGLNGSHVMLILNAIRQALSERGEREGFVSVPEAIQDHARAMLSLPLTDGSFRATGCKVANWVIALAARPGQEEGR